MAVSLENRPGWDPSAQPLQGRADVKPPAEGLTCSGDPLKVSSSGRRPRGAEVVRACPRTGGRTPGLMRKQPARGRDVATKAGRGFGLNTSPGGGVCREFIRQRTRPHTQLEGRGGAQPTVGRDLPYMGGRGVARLGARRLWACARRSQGSRRRRLWRETLFEAGE